MNKYFAIPVYPYETYANYSHPSNELMSSGALGRASQWMIFISDYFQLVQFLGEYNAFTQLQATNYYIEHHRHINF